MKEYSFYGQFLINITLYKMDIFKQGRLEYEGYWEKCDP